MKTVRIKCRIKEEMRVEGGDARYSIHFNDNQIWIDNNIFLYEKPYEPHVALTLNEINIGELESIEITL